MHFKLNFSSFIIVVVIAFTCLKGFEYKRWENKQIIQSDVICYYDYLPAVFIYHDISLKFWPDKLVDKTESKFWFFETPDHKSVIRMTSGVAILQIPFFLCADGLTMLKGLPNTGFSSLYEFWIFIATIFYLMTGLIFLRKSLSLFFEDHVVALTLLSVGIGTNLLCYTVYDSGMSHVYSFCIISIFLWLSIQWNKKSTIKNSILIGLCGGFATLIRPTNAIVFLIPLLWNIRDFASLKIKWIFFQRQKIKLILIAFFGFLGIVPQLVYWKFVTGHWLYYTYNDEGFFFNNPHILEGLFGFRKGFFIYTPIMFLLIPGLVLSFRIKSEYAIVILFFFLLNVYIILSWWCWWYGGSFGLRPMIDSFAILSVPLATCYSYLFKKTYKKVFLFLFISACIVLNIFQLKQFSLSLLHWDSMTAKAYFTVFGKTNYPEGYPLLLNFPDYDNLIKGLPMKQTLRADYLALKTIDTTYAGIKANNQKFVSADKHINLLVANRDYIGEWERFIVIKRPGNIYTIQSSEKYFVGVDKMSKEVCVKKNNPEDTEVFKKVECGQNKFVLKTYNGSYLTIDSAASKKLKANCTDIAYATQFELVNQ
jgi:hypothetical protein